MVGRVHEISDDGGPPLSPLLKRGREGGGGDKKNRKGVKREGGDGNSCRRGDGGVATGGWGGNEWRRRVFLSVKTDPRGLRRFRQSTMTKFIVNNSIIIQIL